MDFPVRVINQPPLRIAYLRCLGLHLDPQKGIAAYQRLMQWAKARDVLTPDAMVIGMSPDNPEITPLAKYRYDLCVTVGNHIKPEGEINVTTISAMRFAMHHCTGDLHQVERAWHYFFKVWLPGSGYQPASLPAMEVFLKLPEEIGWETFDIECCVPIQPL
jgi:DNA gyrase inhibitor GyrI